MDNNNFSNISVSNSDFSDILSKSSIGFQNQLMNHLREALNNASLFYCALKQYGDADDIATAWSTYIRVRDLYEEIMQNFIV